MKAKLKLECISVLIFVILYSCSFAQEDYSPVVQANIKTLENDIFKFAFTARGIVQTDESAPLSERMDEYNIPGLSIAVINNNKLEWARAYGVLRNDSPGTVTEKSIFQAASVSKFITAIIVLHYVEEGIFDLDADVNTYLQSWKIPDNEYTKENKVTLRHLLSHTSGLPSYSGTLRDENAAPPTLAQYIKGEYPAKNAAAIPEFKAGDHWSYSNIGYAVIQLILEDTFRQSLNDIADKVIFRPLHMNSSTFNYPLKKKWQKEEAYPHKTDKTVGSPEQEMPRAMGGFCTTPSDMSKILIELMKAYTGKSEKIISQKTALQMFKSEAQVPPEALGGLSLEMGLGVFLDTSGASLAFLHHGHNSPGTVFLVFAIPEKGQGAVIAANGNIGDRLYLEVLASLSSLYNWESGQFFK